MSIKPNPRFLSCVVFSGTGRMHCPGLSSLLHPHRPPAPFRLMLRRDRRCKASWSTVNQRCICTAHREASLSYPFLLSSSPLPDFRYPPGSSSLSSWAPTPTELRSCERSQPQLRMDACTSTACLLWQGLDACPWSLPKDPRSIGPTERD